MARRDPAIGNPDSAAAAFASAAAIGAAVGGLGMLASGLLGWKEVPPPFAWTDVALVQLLSSLPLGATIAAVIRRQCSAAVSMAFGVACLLAAGGLWTAGSPRAPIALCAAIGLVLVALLVQRTPTVGTPRRTSNIVTALLGLVSFIGLPWVYLEARRSHDDRELGELIDQSRLGEARHLARQSLILDLHRTFRGQPLRAVANELDRVVQQLEASVAVPLLAGTGDDAVLARARDLAMLGRTGEALFMLERAESLSQVPHAANLRGTIWQTRQEFEPSRAAFHQAVELLKPRPASPERTADLATAYTGIAFAERKLGRNAAAESAYQELLQLDPSAETHFLLAQFYEGTQQAVKAQWHARQAMALAPERFETPAQRLIDKLMTHHFGCWGVASAERRSE